MNCYEHTIIIKSDSSTGHNQKTLEKYQNLINKNSGKIIKTEEWGLMTLARNIRNNRKGFYYHIKLEGIGKTIDELERAENIDDSLLRYLTVKVKNHKNSINFFEKKEVKQS